MHIISYFANISQLVVSHAKLANRQQAKTYHS